MYLTACHGLQREHVKVPTGKLPTYIPTISFTRLDTGLHRIVQPGQSIEEDEQDDNYQFSKRQKTKIKQNESRGE
jgi:hypothetical protein